MDFSKIPKNEKPRERLYYFGADNLSIEELLSILLKTGTKKLNVKEVSCLLLEYLGDIKKLDDVSINSLINIEGIGKVKAIELKAAIELGKRVYINDIQFDKISFNNSIAIYEYFKKKLCDKKQEFFYCAYLDTKSKIIEIKCLFIGTINSSVVHPREIFKFAYLLSANGIVCVHNHPSGDSNPSKEDILLTRKIKEISVIHGIKLIDHIIVGRDEFYSFYEHDMI